MKSGLDILSEKSYEIWYVILTKIGKIYFKSEVHHFRTGSRACLSDDCYQRVFTKRTRYIEQIKLAFQYRLLFF